MRNGHYGSHHISGPSLGRSSGECVFTQYKIPNSIFHIVPSLYIFSPPQDASSLFIGGGRTDNKDDNVSCHQKGVMADGRKERKEHPRRWIERDDEGSVLTFFLLLSPTTMHTRAILLFVPYRPVRGGGEQLFSTTWYCYGGNYLPNYLFYTNKT